MCNEEWGEISGKTDPSEQVLIFEEIVKQKHISHEKCQDQPICRLEKTGQVNQKGIQETFQIHEISEIERFL